MSDPATEAAVDPAVQYAIHAHGLTKQFGQQTAVDRLNLTVPTGSMFGLLGPNGAGKSTTLSMITGLLRPDAGLVTVNGMSVWPDPTAVKATIGVVPENLLLFERLSAREYLSYVGRFRRLDNDVVEVRTNDLLAVLDLESADDKLITDFSMGMRKKISLAAALLHAPPLLILDEPFESVDPVSQRSIRQILDQLLDAGGTVVLSSHVMATVEELCDWAAIMHHGRLLRHGPMSEIRSGQRLDDVFARTIGSDAMPPTRLDWLNAGAEVPTTASEGPG